MPRSNRFPESIGIVVGLASEARLARRLSQHVRCAASQTRLAELHAADLIRSGATALVSFGIAGGLSPDLAPGELVIPDKVLTADRTYAARTEWADALGGRVGPIYGDAALATSPAYKSDLHVRTGALAVDMESGAVAAVAERAGVPFYVVRAIADTADRGLPPAAQLPMNAQGNPRIHAVLASVLMNPGQIPALLTTARDTQAALKALQRACTILAG